MTELEVELYGRRIGGLSDSLTDVTPPRSPASGRADAPFVTRTAPGGWGGPVA